MNSYVILFCLQNSDPDIHFFSGLSQPANRAASTSEVGGGSREELINLLKVNLERFHENIVNSLGGIR